MSFEEPQSHLLELPAAAAAKRRHRGIVLLSIASALVGMTIYLQIGLNDNFVVEQIGLDGQQKGLLEGIRETCGITALGVLAILAGFAEPLIAVAMLILVGVGLAGYAGVHDFFWLAVLSVIWSQGLHVWIPLPNSMMLSLAEPGKTGHRLGQLQAAGAAGGVGILLVILVMTILKVPIRPLYLLGGGAAILAAVVCLGLPRDIKTPGPRFVFRRRYGLYYLLSFLEGWRKQIFLAFAGFLLVKNYGLSLTAMLAMWTAVQAMVWLLSPLVGKLIDRLGERTVLTCYYVTMTVIFCGYAFIQDRYLLAALFMTDNIMFTLGLALTTYVRRIAPPSEHTPTLSMGVAMNHIAAFAMPVLGGWLWIHKGYQWTFFVGAAAAALSILVVRRLPRHDRLAEGPG